MAKETKIEQKRMFANDVTDKMSVSKIYTIRKINNPIKKMGRYEQTFFQRRHTDYQQAHEKMLNITNHQGKVSHNQNEA